MNGPVLTVLLAAGRASRFGGGKLDAAMGGEAIGKIALEALLATGLGRPHIVVANPAPQFAVDAERASVAELQFNAQSKQGIGSSIALAARLAKRKGCKAILLTLADMPAVASATLLQLVQCTTPNGAAAVRYPNGKAGIPACLPASFYSPLTALEGDTGAAGLLRADPLTHLIDVAPHQLRDIDTTADLATWSDRV